MKTKLSSLLILLLISKATAGEIVDRTLAVVNSEVILQSDLAKIEQKLKHKNLLDEMILPENTDLLFKKDRSAMLDYLINEKIFDSEVRRLNFSVTSERVNQEIKDLAKRNNITTDEVLKSVAREGISVSDYQDSLRNRLEHQSVVESEIVSKLRISDEDALAEFTKLNPGSHVGVNEYTISHIFFSPKGAGAEAAMDKANRVMEQIKSGKSFDSMVQKHSEDSSGATGGLLGTFKSGEISDEFELAIKSLSPGQYSAITKSKAGFHILRLNSVKAIPDPRFEKAKDSIKARLFDRAFKRQLRVWLQSKKDEAFIRVNK